MLQKTGFKFPISYVNIYSKSAGLVGVLHVADVVAEAQTLDVIVLRDVGEGVVVWQLLDDIDHLIRMVFEDSFKRKVCFEGFEQNGRVGEHTELSSEPSVNWFCVDLGLVVDEVRAPKV